MPLPSAPFGEVHGHAPRVLRLPREELRPAPGGAQQRDRRDPQGEGGALGLLQRLRGAWALLDNPVGVDVIQGKNVSSHRLKRKES